MTRMGGVWAAMLVAVSCCAAWVVAVGEDASDKPQHAATAAAASKSGDTAAATAKGPQEQPDAEGTGAAPVKSVLSGRVVLLTEALKRRGIKSYAEENQGQVVLETAERELFPIVPDWRGRTLFQDERLRNRPVDLLVYRHRGVPHLQVLSIYTFDEAGARQLTDYWCDICSIPMYEIKDCECCQGPIRLRFRKDGGSEE